MKLLGTIGIDPVLLVAQIVNFLVLLWVLTRYLYKPIVKKIEENEKELISAKESMSALEKEKLLFLQQQKEELIANRTNAQQIIKEAEEMADKIQKKYVTEYQQNKASFLKHADMILISKEHKLENDLKRKIGSLFTKELHEKLKPILTPDVQKQMNQYFFNQLLDQLTKSDIHKSSLNTSSIIKKLEALAQDTPQKHMKILGNQVQKDALEKMGVLRLDFVSPLTVQQKNTLTTLLAKKLQIDKAFIKIKEKKDLSVLSGFRLEVNGIVIDSNLGNELVYEN
jgi:F-type H+-transporting ATPase subunit b